MAHGLVSLRLKLTLWYVLVFAALQVTLLLATVLLRRDLMQRAFDAQLRQRAETMAQRLTLAPPPWSTETLRGLATGDAALAVCAVRNRSGEIVAASSNRDLRGLPDLDPEALQATATGAILTTLSPAEGQLLTGTEQTLRVLTLRFKDGQGNACYLQAATRAEFLEQLLGPLLDLFVFGVPIGLFAASVPAWLIARRATAPIHQILAAARRVSPGSSRWGLRLTTRDPEVARLHAELNQALERLEAGFRAQERFVSNVSHELRTPITVLLTESQVLKAGQPTLPECLVYLGSVEDEMRRLGRLVESILSLARAGLEACPAHWHRISVNDLVLRATRHANPLARRSRVRLVPRLTPSEPDEDQAGLIGDLDLLCTMLENLIRNAIRFSPRGEIVEVEARMVRGHARLLVRDRGPGIPEEYLDRVFDRFVQAPDDRRTPQGVGLGLAIAREVAVLHGGTIAAHNRGHGGCAVGVTLPLTRRRPRGAA